MSDLISRRAALDGKIPMQLANGVEIYSDEAVPVEYLKRLPSVEPVRHGKWVPKTIIIGGCDHVSGMKCSVCGEDPLNAEGDEFLTDYCPNCGARMDEE